MLLFKGATLLTNDPARECFVGDLRVQGGRITEIAPSLSPLPGETVKDLSGKVLLPGFVQTHVHLCQTLFRNLADDLPLLDWLSQKIWPMEAAHTPASLRASAELGIMELLAGGTTTILDMGTVRHTEEIFAAAERFGIRAFIGKCLMDSESCPAGLRESKVAALKEMESLHKSWHGRAEGRLHYAPAPRFVISCTEGLLREVKDFAQQENLRVHTHASENREEIAEVRKLTGKENIEYLKHLGLTNERLVLAHCVWVSDDEVRTLAESKTHISHCPSSNLKLASGIAPTPQLMRAGVNISLGADGAPCNNQLNMFQEMRLASLLQKPQHGATAMPAREVFRMATLNGAKALGLEHEVGALRVGLKADLIALDLTRHETFVAPDERLAETLYAAIVYSSSPANVLSSWVEGRLVYEKGQYPGHDAEEILRTAQRQKRLLLDTLGHSR